MDVSSLVAQFPPGVVFVDAETLARHSLDWWPLAWLRRSRGDPDLLPIAVVRPRSASQVCRLLHWAHATRTPVVTRGGGSGVAGGATSRGGDVVLDMSGLNAIVDIDAGSRTAVVQAGVRGDVLEEALRAEGLTLGHYPQSLSMSTVGGWIATAGVGHASSGFGAVADRVVGLQVVLADGRLLELRDVHRSAVGPDLRRLFVGSEGTLGVITQLSLSLAAAPGPYRWCAFQLPTFRDAIDACQTIAQSNEPVLVVRAYDEQDTALTFGEAMKLPGCAVIAALDSEAPQTDEAVRSLAALVGGCGGLPLARVLGEHWFRHHRDALETYRAVMGADRAWGTGVIVDTVEVAALWSRVSRLYDAIRGVLAEATELVACHMSHLHPSGGSLYFTFLLRAPDDERAETEYLRAWSDVVAACHAAGGTMSHHHGVGRLKAPFMRDEVGEAGLDVLRGIKQSLDPYGILNPGTLFSSE